MGMRQFSPDDAGHAMILWSPALRPRVDADGHCAGLFYPDLLRNPSPGRHLDHHWNGERVDLFRDASEGHVFRV
jgi:hypothetical protein